MWLTSHYLYEYSIPTLSLNRILATVDCKTLTMRRERDALWSAERVCIHYSSLRVIWASGAARTISQNCERVGRGGRRRDDTSGHITELLDSEMGRQTGLLNRDMWMHAGLESWLVGWGGGGEYVCVWMCFFTSARVVFCIADWKALIFPPISFYRITDRDCSTYNTRVDSLFLIWEKS